MKTPYDAARRLKRRELDDVRQALGEAESQHIAFAQMIRHAEDTLARERHVATADPRIDIGPYAAAKRVDIARLRAEMVKIEAKIEALRAGLLEKFEALKPLDFAEEDYRRAARRVNTRREQAKLDEMGSRRRTGNVPGPASSGHGGRPR